MVLGAATIAGWYAPGQTEVIALATGLIGLAALFQLSDGLQAVAAGALRGWRGAQTTRTGEAPGATRTSRRGRSISQVA